MRRVLLSAALAALATLPAAPLAAQRDAGVQIELPHAVSTPGDPPGIRSMAVLAGSRVGELLHSGFPARLHYRLELWASRPIFDDLVKQVEWDVIVRYYPLEERYAVTRVYGDRVSALGTFRHRAGVEHALENAFAPPGASPPARRGRYYYRVSLDVAMLSVNDLDEVERWLHGDLQPAVRGKKSAGTAITRGAETLITRLLGGEQRHYEARSGVFRVP